MKKKIIVITVSLFIICLALLFYYLNTQEKQLEMEQTLADYNNAAYIFRLDIDDSLFLESGNEKEINLSATTKTWEVMDRWEKLAEVFPDIYYPVNEINQEQWMAVRQVYFANTTEIENAAIELAEGSPEDDYPGVYSMDEYILRGNISTPYLEEQLELRGIKD